MYAEIIILCLQPSDYGIDWEGPIGNNDFITESDVQVPESMFELNERLLHELESHVNPFSPSEIDLYVKTKMFLLSSNSEY